MAIRALLWDFGDTLADERWLQAPMVGAPRWSQLYREFAAQNDLADQWNIGAASSLDVANWFATQLGEDVERVRNHMAQCCKAVSFFPLVRALTDKRALSQAIVTVNPDIFTLFVVPAYALDTKFDLIVTSWESRSTDKAELCDLAIAKWGSAFSRDECLLIDNRLDCVEAWRKTGGAAYHFRNETDLVNRFAGLIGAKD